MGGEFAQGAEWSHEAELDWRCLEKPLHAGVQRWVADLNRLLRATPALHERDFDSDGFAWVDASDAGASVIAFERRAGDRGAWWLLRTTSRRCRAAAIGLVFRARVAGARR